MTLNQFLIAFAFNVITQAIPVGLAIYIAIRFAIAHGELRFRRQEKNYESVSSQSSRRVAVEG